MNRAYWDAVAANYDHHILSVFEHDSGELIRSRINAAADSRMRSADLGCGVGKFTPLLAQAFVSVEACDFSEACLAEARRHCRAHANIRFRHLDFAVDPCPFEPVGFVLCVNVLIMADLDARMRAWRMVTNQVAHDGVLLLVLPSLESSLYRDFRMIDDGLSLGLSCAEALRTAVPQAGDASALHQGVRELEGVPTKHYLREELEVLIDHHGFDRVEITRIEYDWTSMAPGDPERKTGPRPWDWLVQARRR